MHRNVYEVYKAKGNGGEIHQILQKSFSGEALTQEYIEHFSTLAKMEFEETAMSESESTGAEFETAASKFGTFVLESEMVALDFETLVLESGFLTLK